MSDRSLDPNAFYTAHDLWLRLGIATDVTEKARANRRLSAVDLRPRSSGQLLPDNRAPATRGEQFLYKGSAVLSWLDEGAQTEPNAPSRRAGPMADLQTGGNQTMSDTNAAKRRVTAQWEAAVAEKVKQGRTHAQAKSEVVRENPDLHKAYLIEFNRDNPAAVRGIVAS
jgi:hypothetical protein